jgi:putative addiction module component (TIGR02574 family)
MWTGSALDCGTLCVILFTMIDESLLAKVSSLSPAERLELIGVVWDTLSPNDLPVTDAERALLDARLADMERNADDQNPWPEVKARLERLLR